MIRTPHDAETQTGTTEVLSSYDDRLDGFF